jgi:hypothetical protein
VKRFKRLTITELLHTTNNALDTQEKKHLDFFCASDIRDFSGEVPMLLGWDYPSSYKRNNNY